MCSRAKKEVYVMTAYYTSKSGYCGTAAAAYTAAHNSKILDTALGVVSIVISCEIPLVRT